MPIHPTAIIDPKAEIHETAEIGPYVIIEGNVRIGARTRLMAFVHVNGETTIGEDNIIHMGAVIGHWPQDIHYHGEPRGLVIGNRNTIREHASIHRATKEDIPTRVGDDCFLMGNSHIGHDCQIGSGIIIANNAMLAGHVIVEDRANISGGCAVHQFTRIGRFVMMQGHSGVGKDVPPFMITAGTNRVHSLNIIGLKRAGFSIQARNEIKAAYRILYRQGYSITHAVEELKAGGFGPEVQEIIDFIAKSKRGICPGIMREGRGEVES